jgi:uncharacterized protein YjiS (DUF1127 family)
MASITSFEDVHDGGFRVEGFIARARRALAEYRQYRATITELEALSARELRDLGISRFSIRLVAHDSVYGG